MSLSVWSAKPQPEDVKSLSYPDHFYRLLHYVIERMGLIFHRMEIDIHQIDTADIAVPCSPVVHFHRSLVRDCRKLGGSLKVFRNIIRSMLGTYRNVEVVQYMKSLYYSIETGRLHRSV